MNLDELTEILADIHSQLLLNAVKAVNIALTMRNWLYGYYIQEYELNGQDRAKYGEKMLENLSKLLRTQGVSAASYRHLKLCRQFYRHYSRIGQTVFAQFNKIAPRRLPYFRQTPFAQSALDVDFPSLPGEKLLAALSYSHFIELVKVDGLLKMYPGDNLPIGMLLCTRKNNALVEYALSEVSNQLFVSEYRLALPSEAEIKSFIESQLKTELIDFVD